MIVRLISFLLILSFLNAETASAVGQQAIPSPAPLPSNAASAPVSGSVTVPAGTVVPLTLVSPIRSRGSKPGDLVRAQVAFPISVGNQIAIPVGTYVEGTLVKPVPKRGVQTPPVTIHFTRLLYANGYSVALDAQNTAANLLPASAAPAAVTGSTALAELAEESSMRLVSSNRFGGPYDGSLGDLHVLSAPELHAYQTTPTLPPQPSLPGPPKAFVISLAVSLAVFASLTIYFIVRATHRGPTPDMVLLGQGYSFQMTLASPLTIDATQAMAAAAAAPAQ